MWITRYEFSAVGYLQNALSANGSPVADLFVAMAETPWFVDFVNVAVPWGEVLIGLGLLAGFLILSTVTTRRSTVRISRVTGVTHRLLEPSVHRSTADSMRHLARHATTKDRRSRQDSSWECIGPRHRNGDVAILRYSGPWNRADRR